MAGAAILAGKAALRAGAGLVKIVTPECNRTIIQTALPEALLMTYEETDDPASTAKEICRFADCIAIGPGLGQSEFAALLLKKILKTFSGMVILDADALNLAAKEPEILHSEAPRLVTPHLGEMARLMKKSVPEIADDLIGTATEFARMYDCFTILKDAHTVTASPDDGPVFINTSGNSGMATGGSGDVLCGLLAGMSAQEELTAETAALACYIHGQAGDYMSERKGQAGLIAGDLVDGIAAITKNRTGR